MATNAHDTDDRLPTTGPEPADYGRYRHVTTGEECIVYDDEQDDAWIQATNAVALDTWR